MNRKHQGTSPRGDGYVLFGTLSRRLRSACVFSAVLLLAVQAAAAQPPWGERGDDAFQVQRFSMVEQQIQRRGVREPDLLDAMSQVPRHLFVPESARAQAYEDRPIAIDDEQTLPQAYLSARMIELLELQGNEKVLEIGTGSGYEAAILSRVVRQVLTIEIDEAIARRARNLLEKLGYDNVRVRVGNGYHGWPEEAPFDAILVTAAPETIPDELFAQLKVGGRMVVAVGGVEMQDLQVITKTSNGRRKIILVTPVVLGPMVDEDG